MGLQISRFSRCRSEDFSIGAVDAEGWWSPVAGVGRRGWHLNFLGSGGGVGVFMEVVWSQRRSGTPWRSLVVAATSEMNGSMP